MLIKYDMKLCVLLFLTVMASGIIMPKQLNATTATAVVAGMSHTCSVLSGYVWCWGDNSRHQLGNGTTKYSLGATRVKLENGAYIDRVTKLSADASGYYTCAIRLGIVYCWGEINSFAKPIQNNDGTYFTGVTKFVIGSSQYCALKYSQVLCWDKNNSPSSAQLVRTNSAVLTNVIDVQGGERHFCALVKQSVWCWGDGVLGSGPLVSSRAYAERVQFSTGGYLHNIKMISVSGVNACAVTKGNIVYCWGENANYESCISGDSYLYKATKASYPCQGNGEVRSISAGYFHTCMVAAKVYCWGVNRYRQTYFGWGWTKFSDANVLRIGLGLHHTCAIKKDEMWCWGLNDVGQLGDGTVNSIQPQPASKVVYSNYQPFK